MTLEYCLATLVASHVVLYILILIRERPELTDREGSAGVVALADCPTTTLVPVSYTVSREEGAHRCSSHRPNRPCIRSSGRRDEDSARHRPLGSHTLRMHIYV